MPTVRVDREDPDRGIIERAAEIIQRGGLVAFPTETVYGLGANALDDAAVGRIYAAKGRPSYNPLIVHVADVNGARELVTEWPPLADRLTRAFWPGPLTLVLPRDPRGVTGRVSAGLATVAVRVPAHPVALALLRAAGLPIVAPSANPSMGVSPTRAEHVEAGLGERVELILDAGPTDIGIESTVIDLSGSRAALLRPGTLSTDDLAPILGTLEPSGSVQASTPEAPRSSPGMLERHYAPEAAVHVFGPSEAEEAAAKGRRVVAAGGSVGSVLLSGPPPATDMQQAVRMAGDPAGYARELYAVLHRLDQAGCDLILVEAVPSTPAWAGIRDRLRRAATDPGAGGSQS